MYKLYAFWSAPLAGDRAAFEAYYRGTYLPRAAALPHLVYMTTTLVDGGAEGDGGAADRIAEFVFADRVAYEASGRSRVWRSVRAAALHMMDVYGAVLTTAVGEEVFGDLAPRA